MGTKDSELPADRRRTTAAARLPRRLRGPVDFENLHILGEGFDAIQITHWSARFAVTPSAVGGDLPGEVDAVAQRTPAQFEPATLPGGRAFLASEFASRG